jgi:hypothetical protein
MGMQNIKGTGLDFVYRWQAWETCFKACELLRGQSVRDIEWGLKELGTFREFGVLSGEYVRDTIERVRRSPLAQREQFQAELSVIESNLARVMRSISEELTRSETSSSRARQWVERVCTIVEEFFDAGDAVKRRKIANVIYRDLVAERISSERAALELQGLNKRQKGGWLFDRLSNLHRILTRHRRSFAPTK